MDDDVTGKSKDVDHADERWAAQDNYSVVSEGEVTGVLDRELAGVGDPPADLALLCSPPVRADLPVAILPR